MIGDRALARAVGTRRGLRHLRLGAAVVRHWGRSFVRANVEPRVFDGPLLPSATSVGASPLVARKPSVETEASRLLADQTEAVRWVETVDDLDAGWLVRVPTDPVSIPAAWLELLLMSAASSPVSTLATSVSTDSGASLPGPTLLDLGLASRRRRLGARTIDLHSERDRRKNHVAFGESAAVAVDRPAPVDQALRDLPTSVGPRTVLFTLPFLAVGGAEHLLIDLVAGLVDDHRVLVVTLDEHRPEIGSTLGRFRDLTPHVYPLGDWLPRSARISALRHLVRRWDVETLFSWNGTVDLYDALPELRRRLPTTRIVTQLFDRTGWLERYSRTIVDAADAHVAVNGPTAEAMAAKAGSRADRVVTIRHGVEVPPLPDPAEAVVRRRRRRQQIGLPTDVIVAATFARLHPQKRPMDLLRLADRFGEDELHFLVVGGGPSEADVVRELTRHRRHNVTRLPMTTEPWPLFEAVDLCLMTSEYEGLPVFLLEGMARQLPFVATGVGDIPRLAREGGGIVVDVPGDLRGLEAAVRRLLDDDVRRSFGEAGRGVVERSYSRDRFVDDYARLVFPSRNGTLR